MRVMGPFAVGCALLFSMGCDGLGDPPPLPDRKIRVPDWSYVQGKYFFLINPNGNVPPPEQVLDVRLYMDDSIYNNNVEFGALPARVWIDPEIPYWERTPYPPATGQFQELFEDQDYVIINESSFGFPRIQLTSPLASNHTLAVAYIQSTGGVVDTVGTWWPPGFVPGQTDSLDLKMLRPSQAQWAINDLAQSVWAPVRFLEAKNVYSLQMRDIEEGSIRIDVVRDIAGYAGNNPTYIINQFGLQTPLLQVLGLDQKNNFNPADRIPDTKVDPEFVDFVNGLLIFPDLRPFDPDLADIDGTSVRNRSWPRNVNAERPDTLGWFKSGDQAIPSNTAWRNQEVVPDIYDLRSLALPSFDPYIYTIEIVVPD